MPTPRAGTSPALALRDGNVGGARGARVLGARPDQPVVAVLLEHVRGPAGHAAHREDRRELVGGDAHGRVARAGVEVHVRVDVLLLGHHARDDVEDFHLALVAVLLAEVIAEYMSERVAAVTRAANVEALNS